VGNVRICRSLLAAWDARYNAGSEEESKSETDADQQKRHRREEVDFTNQQSERRMGAFIDTRNDWRSLNEARSVFINAMDSFGNTAMHMAVTYRRVEVVDWLMRTGQGQQSLWMLNFDGLSPLTLAARLGHVDVFRHVLYKHMSKILWECGKVRSG
jgi:ankyrin repeat protein